MYIRRKVFSRVVENGEEKLFSVNETTFEETKEFSKLDKKLAKKLGKTVKEVRLDRKLKDITAGNTIHSSINAKALEGADSASARKLFPKGSFGSEMIMGPKTKKIANGSKINKLEYDHGWGSGFGQKLGENPSVTSDRVEAMKDVMSSRKK